MDKFIKGMDVSTLPEETALGAKYYDEGKEGDAQIGRASCRERV